MFFKGLQKTNGSIWENTKKGKAKLILKNLKNQYFLFYNVALRHADFKALLALFAKAMIEKIFTDSEKPIDCFLKMGYSFRISFFSLVFSKTPFSTH